MGAALEQTFIQQINQHLGIAHKVCGIYFPNEDEKKDVVQEMMYQLWRSYPSFDGRSKFSTWMYSVCLNTALTYLRNNKKHKNLSLSQNHQQIPDEPAADQEDNTRLLSEAIAALSQLNKAIVLLYLEDLSYEEIAQITGLTRSNVSVRLVRIRKELETFMKKQSKSYNDVSSR